MRIGAKVNKDQKQNAKDSIGEESNLLTQVIWNKAQDQGGFEKMTIWIQCFMDLMLTTGGKKRTIMSLGSKLWTGLIVWYNDCTFSTLNVPRSMRIGLKTILGLKGEEIQCFDGCSFEKGDLCEFVSPGW